MTQLGRFQVIRRLGRGGMAEVFLAKVVGPKGFEKTLVIKRILPHLVEDPQFVEMFLSEARLVAQLNHANVVQIFDFGEEDGAYFIAMEYIDGPSVHALLKRARAAGRRIAFPLCAKIVSFACEGLAYAHELVSPETGSPLGLIHRDISPDNILLSRNGGVKVVDFGIAKGTHQQHSTQTGVVKGKISYMSPEHLNGEPLDPRADVFALGVVLYELVTGEKPFKAESDVAMIQAILHAPMKNVRESRPDVPEELERILGKALAKEREQRYGSCRALQADLERFVFQSGDPVGPAQIAELLKELVPPEPASSMAMSAQPAPRPEVAAGTEPLSKTDVVGPEEPSRTTPMRGSLVPEVTREAPGARRGLGRGGVLPDVVGPEEPSRTTPMRGSLVPEVTREAAGARWGLGRGGVLLLVLLLGAGGGYLGLRGSQQTPAPQGGTGLVEPEVLRTPPAEVPEVVRGSEVPAEAPRVARVSGVPKGADAPEAPESSAGEAQAPVAEQPAALAPALRETPELASFRVVSNPSGVVSINGKRVGKSPVVVEIKPGKVNVAVSGNADGERFDTSRSVLVKAGANPPITLVPKRLKVTVRGRPRELKVQSLDVQFLGGSAGPLEVYEGWHTLKLTDGAGKSYTAECQARVGDELCLFEVKVTE